MLYVNEDAQPLTPEQVESLRPVAGLRKPASHEEVNRADNASEIDLPPLPDDLWDIEFPGVWLSCKLPPDVKGTEVLKGRRDMLMEVALKLGSRPVYERVWAMRMLFEFSKRFFNLKDEPAGAREAIKNGYTNGMKNLKAAQPNVEWPHAIPVQIPEQCGLEEELRLRLDAIGAELLLNESDGKLSAAQLPNPGRRMVGKWEQFGSHQHRARCPPRTLVGRDVSRPRAHVDSGTRRRDPQASGRS